MSGDCVITALANYLLMLKFDIDIIEKLIFDLYTSDKYNKEIGGMLVSDIPIIIKDKLVSNKVFKNVTLYVVTKDTLPNDNTKRIRTGDVIPLPNIVFTHYLNYWHAWVATEDGKKLNNDGHLYDELSEINAYLLINDR